MYKLLDWIDINKINWDFLSQNPNAIHLLEKNIDKIYWRWLSENPNAMHLLKNNICEIYWNHLYINSSIFELDYDVLKERCLIYMEELIQKTMHPYIIQKYIDLELDIEDF